MKVAMFTQMVEFKYSKSRNHHKGKRIIPIHDVIFDTAMFFTSLQSAHAIVNYKYKKLKRICKRGGRMKKFLIAIALLLIICNAQAVTVSITATNNGNSVSVTNYFTSDGSYQANAKGNVNFGSVNVNENFDYSANANNNANAVISGGGNNYGVGSWHYAENAMISGKEALQLAIQMLH